MFFNYRTFDQEKEFFDYCDKHNLFVYRQKSDLFCKLKDLRKGDYFITPRSAYVFVACYKDLRAVVPFKVLQKIEYVRATRKWRCYQYNNTSVMVPFITSLRSFDNVIKAEYFNEVEE